MMKARSRSPSSALSSAFFALIAAAALAAAPGPAGAATPEGTTSDATLPDAATAGGAAAAPPAAAARVPGDLPIAERCEVPEELAPPPETVDKLAAAFRQAPRPLTIVVLGSLSGQDASGRGTSAFAPRLQAILQGELAARGLDLPLRVEAVGKTRALAGDLAGLIKRQVLPLKPALVIWQVGRADPRQGNPPHRFSQSLKEGLALLRQEGIPAILGDIQFHPQFEALFRTDDYRNYVRWVAGKFDLPLLRRYEMIEHWSQSGLIDLDSGDDADQKAAYGFIQECLAFQATRMIVGAAALAPGKRE